jgi:uncharacterized protein (DUF2267 family)
MAMHEEMERRTELTDPTAEVKTRFVREVASRAHLPAHIAAEDATAAVMCTVTERLTRGGAYKLTQALPEPVRRLFERCVDHRNGPVSSLDRPELLERMALHLGVAPIDADAICRAVLSAVRDALPADVAADVAAQLPADLKALWYSVMPTPSTPIAAPIEPEALRAQVLAAVEREADLPPGVDGAAALMAVMCTFSRRLSGGEARHIVLSLPGSLRSLMTTCALHRDEPAEPFHRGDLARRISVHLGTTESEADTIVRAVLDAVKRCLPLQELEDVASQLPPDLKAMWLGA